MTKTEHYLLNQWVGTDQIIRTDFNADNAKIDAAIAGKPEVVTGSYVGTGTYGEENPSSLTFPFPPKVVGILIEQRSSFAAGVLFIYGQTESSGIGAASSSGGVYSLVLDWGKENTVSWYNTNNSGVNQLNGEGTTYFYFAMG